MIPPPQALVRHWATKGIVAHDATWHPLSGGRTNAVWRVAESRGRGGTALVCKLYRPGGDTPLFGNDPIAERRALEALANTTLAPPLIAAGDTPAGPSIVYGHVAGRQWRTGDDPGTVAKALRILHRQKALAAFAQPETRAEALFEQGQKIVDALGAGGASLNDLRPAISDLPDATPVFLHGDATAGNTLVTKAGVTFIDWQCPALGDATEDLATFLSPAMQVISGNVALADEETEAFLVAYGDTEIARRYRALAPLYHWRMAAYCLWRAARGDLGYAEAADHEIAALKAAMQSRRP